jgi:hypothetical protein
VEQVIAQQAKFHASELELEDVNIDIPDASLHDCIITKNGTKYYINIKIHNYLRKENKNDIAAVEKLYFQYLTNHNYRLIYACFGIKFEHLNISFVKEYVHLFSPQFLPIYINPGNDKIQAYYHHQPI